MSAPAPQPTAAGTPPCDRSISVVLPAYNEEEGIEQAVTACLEFLPEHFADWELIVVDDGSRDSTPEILARLAAGNPQLRVVRHPRNQGYGQAVADGLAAARKELVFFTDADRQFDIRELKDVVPLADDHDAVFCFRVYRYDSVVRCMLSWGYNRLVRVLFRVRVRDVDCSFKLFRRDVVDKLTIECRDFFVDTELVARTARLGFRTTEKGVRHYPRQAGHTTVRPSHIPRTLWTVARMWFRIHFPGMFRPDPARTMPQLRERLTDPEQVIEVAAAGGGRG